MRCRLVGFVCVLVLIGTWTKSHGQPPTPVMEMASVLNGLDVFHANAILQLHGNDALTAAFLPQGSEVKALLFKKGSSQPIHVQTFYHQAVTKVFTSIDTRGKYKEFRFSDPGEYILEYRSGGDVLTRMSFSVVAADNDDEFDPKTFWYLRGPWSDWAYLYSPLKDGADGIVEFRMWWQKVSFEEGTNADEIQITVKRDGDTIATASKGYGSSQEWLPLEFKLRHPESKGGRPVKLGELTANDGRYHVLVRRFEKPYAAWKFDVVGGKLKPHPRQDRSYQPRTEYILPRFAAASRGRDLQGNTIWMERLDNAAAMRQFSSSAAAVKGPTAADRQRWQWIPSADANRPLELVITDVETRSDTNIAVGEDVVVFGTQFPTGVKYLVAGETAAREIPDGETYSSKVFEVCGKKIILVKGKQIVVFDTDTQKLTTIPTSEISLYDVRGGLERPKLLCSNGYLVGTVNNVDAVSDQTIIKIVDVSGETPRVIPIKNSEYTHRDVTAIALDAKAGVVAVSSRQKKIIAVAKIANLANQFLFNLGDYRGVGTHQLFVEREWIIYADEDSKVRLLDLNDRIPKAVTDQPFANSGNGFYVRKGRLVVATQEHFGTRYEMAMSDLPEPPRTLKDTGVEIPETSGSLGMAGCAALTENKVVFLAGTSSGGIGKGEHLQMLDVDRQVWVPLKNESGNVVSAIDVVSSTGFAAFKTADRNRKTTIGYMTYGEDPVPPRPNVAPIEPSAPTEPPNPPTLVDDNPYFTNDEAFASQLDGYLETETTMMEAFVPAFGEKVAKQKALESMLNSMASVPAELLEEYKRRSSLIPETDRPAAAQQQRNGGNVDPEAVMRVLTGQWQALRFDVAGKATEDDQLEDMTITFGQDKYVMVMQGDVETGTFTLKTAQTPIGIALRVGTGKAKGTSREGSIKMLTEDRLLMVLGAGAPSKFISSEDNGNILSAFRKN